MTLFIEQEQSPNHEPRKNGKTPRHLILHYTGCDAETARARFMDGTPDQMGGRLSTHYMVHENGHVTQFVHENQRAWHAGVSYWQGETDINSTSIGIEIVNLGEYAEYPAFAPAQITAVIELCRDILRRHPDITPFNVLGHSDIAPGRKLDPGPNFPWARLAAAGVGVMPEGIDFYSPDDDPRPLLTAIGYNPDVPLGLCLNAFCAHYAPESLNDKTPVAMYAKLATLANMVSSAKRAATH